MKLRENMGVLWGIFFGIICALIGSFLVETGMVPALWGTIAALCAGMFFMVASIFSYSIIEKWLAPPEEELQTSESEDAATSTMPEPDDDLIVGGGMFFDDGESML